MTQVLPELSSLFPCRQKSATYGCSVLAVDTVLLAFPQPLSSALMSFFFRPLGEELDVQKSRH